MDIIQSSPESSYERSYEIPESPFISQSKCVNLREESGKLNRFYIKKIKDG